MNTQIPWYKNAVVYQIYPLSFKDSDNDGYGDLKGVIEKLDYIKDLGVDCIWLSPFYKSPLKDFGYDISDHKAVDPIFGSMRNAEELIHEAHKRDLRIILDLVLNHTSDTHSWFQESKQSLDNPKREWYTWAKGKNGGPPNNWLSVFGGSAWTYDQNTEEWYLHTFLEDQPDLNWRNEEVRKEMYAIIDFWLSKGVDGFRADAIHHLFEDKDLSDEKENPNFRAGQDDPYNALLHDKTSGAPETLKTSMEIADYIKKYGDIFLITEAYLPLESLIHIYKTCGRENHSPFNFNLMSMPFSATEYKNFLDIYIKESEGFTPNFVLGNHDRERIVSRLGKERSQLLGILSLLLPGMSFIYYGEEIGMQNLRETKHLDPWGTNVSIGKTNRDKERGVMQWDDTIYAGFSKVEPWIGVPENHKMVNVDIEESTPDSMLNIYKQILILRKELKALKLGDYADSKVVDEDIFSFNRSYGKENLEIILNMSDKETNFTHRGEIIFSNLPMPNTSTFRPFEARVYRI